MEHKTKEAKTGGGGGQTSNSWKARSLRLKKPSRRAQHNCEDNDQKQGAQDNEGQGPHNQKVKEPTIKKVMAPTTRKVTDLLSKKQKSPWPRKPRCQD